MAAWAPITASTLGATTVVAGIPNKTIVILGFVVSAGATAVAVSFQSHTTTAVKTGLFNLAINGSLVVPYVESTNADASWFEVASGEALDIVLSAAAPVGGQLIYDTV